jgi:hypothetical protein
MTGQPGPGAATPPIDGDDDDAIIVNVDDLPDDVPNDPLPPSEVQVPPGNVADTDVDAPVIGTPLVDDEIGP